MSYPLIILGAGASYDYSPLGDLGEISPLTNQLVERKHIQQDYLQHYPGAGNVMSAITGKVKSGAKTFEEALTEFKDNAGSSPIIQKHFIAFEFYLQSFFKRISTHDFSENVKIMHRINNYRTLVDNIHAYSNGRACIATFNYDTLLERNLPEKRPEKMKDYLNTDIKIIKLHGSHDWCYIHRKSEFRFLEGINNSFELCNQDPMVLQRIKKGAEPIMISEIENHSEANSFFTFPAIAVPLQGKDTFTCPEVQINILKNELKTIDRILIIGWKAADPALLEIIKSHGQLKKIKILVVAGKKEWAQEIAGNLSIKLGIDINRIESYISGFSDFMSDDASMNFFRDSFILNIKETSESLVVPA